MAFGSDKDVFAATQVSRAQVDEGLRQYMLRVYNYMTAGLALTGAVAYAVANTPVFDLIFDTSLYYVVMFAPLVFVFIYSSRIHRMSVSGAQLGFWAFAAVMGLSLSAIFVIYTGTSIARVFFITASVFGGMSLYGYTTKKSLSGWGSFLFMGLIGVIIASIVNIFLQSPALYFAVSIIGVLVFVGLTAYDTQRIKETYYLSRSADETSKNAIMGALRLYLDFINLFIMLLHLFGGRE
jgi:FtsH-binding integral membrane protein